MRILSLPLPREAVKRALFLKLASLLLQVAVLAGCVGDVDDDLPDAPPIRVWEGRQSINPRPAPDAGLERAATCGALGAPSKANCRPQP